MANVMLNPETIGLVPNLVKSSELPVPTTTQDLATANMTVTELDSLGRKTVFTVPLPVSGNYDELTLPQKIWLLKGGRFSKLSIPSIVGAIVYAAQLRRQTGANIDELQGDLYVVQNSAGEITFNLTNKAKIKIANATGRIKGYKINTEELTDMPIALEDCDEEHELECTVEIEVEGLSQPIVKVQRLSEWFQPRNLNWKTRPRHMLELNTFAHACEFIYPTETGDDEIPSTPVLAEPLPAPSLPSLVDQLTASIDAVHASREQQ